MGVEKNGGPFGPYTNFFLHLSIYRISLSSDGFNCVRIGFSPPKIRGGRALNRPNFEADFFLQRLGPAGAAESRNSTSRSAPAAWKSVPTALRVTKGPRTTSSKTSRRRKSDWRRAGFESARSYFRQIAKFLTKIGVPTKRRGVSWHPEMVKRLLKPG